MRFGWPIVLVMVVLVWPPHARAQSAAAIGIQIADAAMERACLAGRPPAPAYARMLEKKANDLMRRYLDFATAGDSKGLAKQFTGAATARWSTGGTQRPVNALTDPFLVGVPRSQVSLEQLAFVAGGDQETGRGIWLVTIDDGQTKRSFEYGMDMAPNGWGMFRILHLTVFTERGKAVPPVPFCHLSMTASY